MGCMYRQEGKGREGKAVVAERVYINSKYADENTVMLPAFHNNMEYGIWKCDCQSTVYIIPLYYVLCACIHHCILLLIIL